MTERPIPAPIANPEDEAFWKAASEGKFVVGHCKSCDKSYWFPRPICPLCFSNETELKPASGKGKIYSFSIARRAPVPFAIAYVTLEEGPHMMANIVDCDLDKIAIDQAVKVVFKPSEDGPPVPMFTPA